MKKKYQLITLLLAVLCACTDIEPEMTVSARPVVQAYLFPNQIIEIEVMREILFDDSDTTHALTNLVVRITEGDTEHTLPGVGAGKYKKEGLIAKKGKSYTLMFEYNGSQIMATTTVPEQPENFVSSAASYTVASFQPGAGVPPTFPDPIELSWKNNNQQYFLVAVKNIESAPEEINANSNRPAFVFRNDPSQNSTYQIRPQQFQYYGSHQIILYRLTPEYAALYQNNGSSSLNIKTPYTNVTNGLGIFTGVNADTLQLEVLKP